MKNKFNIDFDLLIRLNDGMQYDDETYVPAGTYEFKIYGINGWPMIKLNDEWLDLVIENQNDKDWLKALFDDAMSERNKKIK